MSPSSRRTHTPSLRSMAGNRIKGAHRVRRAALLGRLRFPVEEICDQRKPKFLALFRMELSAGIIVASHQGRDRSAIVRLGYEVGIVGGAQMVAVNEIGVQSSRPQRNAGKELMGLAPVKRIPAYMRDFE